MIHIHGDIPPRESRDYATASQNLSRAIRELIDAGAAERVRSGGNGRTAVYRLNLDPAGRGPATREAVDTVHNVLHSSG